MVPALKPGGRLIYSVCTLTKAETTEVAEAITRQFPELEPLPLRNPLKPEEAVEGLVAVAAGSGRKRDVYMRLAKGR